MKIFGGKRKVYRGKGRSPEQKAKEETARTDAFLARTWRKYLESHPTFARQIAMDKYGMSSSAEYEGGDSREPSSLSDKVKETKSFMSLVQSEFGGGSKESGLVGILKDFVKSDTEGNLARSLAGVITRITQQGEQLQPPRIEFSQPPRLEPPRIGQSNVISKPTLEHQQELILNLVNRLKPMEPQLVAHEIYQEKDKPGTILSKIYQGITENEFEGLVALVPLVVATPEYQFLAPSWASIDQKWLAAVYDEVVTLKNTEKGIN